MPIDPTKYPPNWAKGIRPAILKRAKDRCEQCGLRNYELGWRDKTGVWHRTPGQPDSFFNVKQAREWCNVNGQWDRRYEPPQKVYAIVLTVAHLDHDTMNSDPANLKALCQYCKEQGE